MTDRKQYAVIPQKEVKLILSKAARSRIGQLMSRFAGEKNDPVTVSYVIRQALQCFGWLIDEVEAGAQFYVKRPGDEQPEPITIVHIEQRK